MRLWLLPIVAGLLALVSLMGLLVGSGSIDRWELERAGPATPDTQSGGTAALRFAGARMVSWSRDEYRDPATADSLDRLRQTGANYVGILVTHYMDGAASSAIAPDPRSTPGDEALVQAIRQAHSRRLKVMLTPHVDVKDGTWRGAIAPADKAAWFNSYRRFLLQYARLAQANGVEMLLIGCELKGLSGSAYKGEWERLIGEVRSVYQAPKPLVYAANWDEYPQVSFWSSLDYAGIDAYFPLTKEKEPTLLQFVNGWTRFPGSERPPDGVSGSRNWVAEMESFRQNTGKDIIFTEIGYRSIQYGGWAPFAFSSEAYLGGPPAVYSEEVQARAYEAVLQAFKDKAWLKGIFWWAWSPNPNAGGPMDLGYYPQNKAAEKVLRQYYGR